MRFAAFGSGRFALKALTPIVAKSMDLSLLQGMAVTNEMTRRLVEFLVGQQPFIGEQMVRTVRATGIIRSAQALTDQELIDHFPQLFADLVEYFITEADPETRKRTVAAAINHGMTRWRQGYQLTEIVRELGLVHRAILEHAVERFFDSNPQWIEGSKATWKNLAGFFEDWIAGSVQRYVENYTAELRRVNGELLESNKILNKTDAARLRLIRTVSHEISNVLNALQLTIALLKISDDPPRREEMLRTCQRNVQDMGDLLDDLKNYSLLLNGIDEPEIEEIDLKPFASELESSFRAKTAEAGLRLILRLDPDLATVRSDRKKIRRIITNLITNAINYRCLEREQGTVTLAFSSLDENSWQMMVEDSGIGIAPEHFETIFEEFKRVNPTADIKGSGLGLAITKRLVDELKGKIEVFSEIGKGSRFVLTLPKA
jgi:signal transduction histidine kinase